MLLLFIGDSISSTVIGGAVAGGIVGIFLVIGISLYYRFRIQKAKEKGSDLPQPTETITTSAAYGIISSSSSQEISAYATVDMVDATSLQSLSPMTSNPAYSTTTQF